MGDKEIGAETGLLGRSLELQQLSKIAADLRRGRGRIVFLTGSAGVGKTTLAQSFLRELKADDPSIVALSARCVEGLTPHRPYGVFRDLLAELQRASPGADMNELVGYEATHWMGGDCRAQGRGALFNEYLEVLHAVGNKRAIATVVDDLQWSDRSSIDLLSHIATSLPSLPLLLLVTFETGGKQGAVSVSGVRRRVGSMGEEITVRPLQDAAIEGMVEGFLDRAISGDVIESMVRAALGSPFYVNQTMRSFLERDLIRKKLFRLTVKEEDLPDGHIDQVLRQRLDALDPNLRWTLEAASFSGCVIDSRVVAGQVEKAEGEVLAQLREADSAHGLLEELEQTNAGASGRFRFSHPLIRRSFRGRVPAKRHGRLVERAASTVEKLTGESVADVADELTALYLSVGAELQANKWSQAAADLAERLYAPYEAERFLRLAARTSPDPIQRTRLEHRLAALYAATGREPEAEQLLEVVVERCQGLDDRVTEARAGSLLGWLRLERGVQPIKLSVLSGQLVDSARRSEIPEALVTATDLACVVAERIGRAEEALMMGEEALHVAGQSGDRELLGQAAFRLARVHISWGNPSEGRSLALQALEVFRELHADRGVTECHDLLGLADFRTGDWDGAQRNWSSALESLGSNGAPAQTITMQLNLAELATLRGDFQGAQRLYDSALQLAEKVEDERLALRCRVGLARMEFERGDYAAVLKMTDEIRGRMPESGAWREDFQTTAIRALSYLEQGDELQAWQEAARVEQLFQGKDGWFERRAEGDAVRIRVIDLDSDAWLAGMVAQQGIGETSDKDPYGEGFLQYHQACVQSRSNPGEARKAAERAVELFSKLGAQPMLARAQTLLADLPAGPPVSEEADENELTDDKIDSWFDNIDE